MRPVRDRDAQGSNPGPPDQFLNTNPIIPHFEGRRRVTAGSQFPRSLRNLSVAQCQLAKVSLREQRLGQGPVVRNRSRLLGATVN